MKKYREYSPSTICVKCGGRDISVKHTGMTSHIIHPPNVLLRKCSNCGYFWYEEPLDKSLS